MADPIIVDLPADTWVKCGTGVTTGQVNRLSKEPNLYLQTYRMTGNAAPTDQCEGVPIFLEPGDNIISSAAAIDPYIMAVGKNGKIRMDL